MNGTTKNLTLSAMFIALAIILPYIAMQNPVIAQTMLPMHFPILLCGLICGHRYGLIVGFISPLMRGFMFGMPPLFPMGTAMAFELATYGFVAALVYYGLRRSASSLVSVYAALIAAMIAGRIVFVAAWILFVGVIRGDEGFSWLAYATTFFTVDVVRGLPGIAAQLILIPVLVVALQRTGLLVSNEG
ncbi:MAG: ECF transporter S component [Defluviitaleaceae bacterium]|nr:ECF transporter S component [Defluviitaleaceae bacterium]